MESGIMLIICLVILVLIILIWRFLALEMSQIAEAKGYYANRYFHICFWLGLPGYLIVIALPDLKALEKQDKILTALTGQPAKNENNNAKASAFQLPSL